MSRQSESLREVPPLPGDKSLTHRALLFAALSSRPTRIEAMNPGDDCRRTQAAIAQLGVEVQEASRTSVRIVARPWRVSGESIDCGNSGTTMRLLAGVCAGHPFPTVLTGDASLCRRPMDRVATPLAKMGAKVRTTKSGTAPIRVDGARPLRGVVHDLRVPSAQVKSALLLAGLFADRPTVVQGGAGTRDHTERLLSWFAGRNGPQLEIESDRVRLLPALDLLNETGLPLQGLSHRPSSPAGSADSDSNVRGTTAAEGLERGEASPREEAPVGRASAADVERSNRGGPTSPSVGEATETADELTYVVPADPSAAAFVLVAACLRTEGAPIMLRNVLVNPTRIGAVYILQRLGLQIEIHDVRLEFGEPVASIVAYAAGTDGLRATQVLRNEVPTLVDEIPILALAATQARGRSVFHGLSELRVKESDRLTSIVRGLSKLGARISIGEDDSLLIDGPTTLGARSDGPVHLLTESDHRLAMTWGVAARLCKQPIVIEDSACVAVSDPDYFSRLAAL